MIGLMRYLLDTNVLSEPRRPRADAGVITWLLQNEMACAISDLAVAELVKGAFRLPPGARQDAILQWIGAVEIQFQGRTLPLSFEVLKRWGQLCGESERDGRRLQVLDSLIAATALHHDLILVTRNEKDFPPEVSTLNPWTD